MAAVMRVSDVHGAERDRPDTVVRPPRMFLAALLAGIALDRLWPLAAADGVTARTAGGVMAVAGIALVAAAMRQFRAAGTNVPTVKPALALVTGGLYRHSRNPIYIGLCLVYLGITLAAAGVWAFMLFVPVLIVLRYGVIAREERYLDAKFGDAWRRYAAATRRWL